MAYSIESKEKAISLRRRGFSIKEIACKLNIAQSTSSLWLKDVSLSKRALMRLQKRVTKGQLISAENKKKKINYIQEKCFKNGMVLLRCVGSGKVGDIMKIYCALLYYCEGAKSSYYFQFTNSDPALISSFLYLLRNNFAIDESKFRISLHLHSYHSPQKQIKFWSEITKIPPRQFIKPYKKSNSGRRRRLNYQGCVNIKYYDTNLAREILGISTAFLRKYGRVR